jgi:hypothetical protein
MRRAPAWLTRYRAKLLAPYIAVFALMGLVGYQVTGMLFAAPVRADVELSTDRSNYTSGQPIRFTISNNTARTFYVVNNCPQPPLEVYAWDGSGWQRRQSSADPLKCQGEPSKYELGPQKSVSASYYYWPELFRSPGRYRLVAPIEGYDSQPSVEFSVGQ